MELGRVPLFEEPDSEIRKRIENLGVETDFSIICGQKIFRAHKVVFGTFSQFLLEQFLQQKTGNFIYLLENVEPVDVENILVFVYEGQVNATAAKSTGFLRAAQQLKIESLVKGLEKLEGVDEIESDDYFGMPVLTREDLSCSETELPSNAISIEDNASLKNKTINSSGQVVSLKVPTPSTSRALPGPGPSREIRPESKLRSTSPLPPHLEASVLATVTTVRNKAKKPRIATPLPKNKSDEKAIPPHDKEIANIISQMLKKSSVAETKLPKNVDIPKKQDLLLVKRIGYPLMSSTKLSQENPDIHDRVKIVPVVVEKKSKIDPKNVEKLPAHEKPIPDEKDKTFLKQTPKFCLATLVEKSSKANENDTNWTNNNPGGSQILHQSTSSSREMSCSSSALRKDGKPLRKVLTKKLPKKKLALESTTFENELQELRRKSAHRRKTLLLKSAKDSKDSGFIGEFRKKLPVAKRRRIPASTRPHIVSSTFNSNV